MNYLVVLFKNKEKRKIINKFKTKEKALGFYNNLLSKSDETIFEKKIESGLQIQFEVCLLEKKSESFSKIYIKDELGRTIKVETDSDEFDIIKINYFKVEEEFLDYQTKSKITSKDFENKYLKKSGIKLISKLNNKIVLQNDDDVNLFTFKNTEDANRFIDSLQEKYLSNKRMDCIFVKDVSFAQKKYLYNLLVGYGFPISYLQRYSTTHLSKK